MRWFVFLLALAACAPPPPERPTLPPTPQADSCNATRYSDLIGADRDRLEKTLILQPVRIITPGSAVSMDYMAGRLNIYLNSDGTVTRLSCG